MKCIVLLLGLIALTLPATVQALGITPTSLELQEGERQQLLVHNTGPYTMRLAFHVPAGFVINATEQMGAGERARVTLRRTNASQTGLHTLTIYARPDTAAKNPIITGARVIINASKEEALRTSYAAAKLRDRPEARPQPDPLIGATIALLILGSGVCAHHLHFLFSKNS